MEHPITLTNINASFFSAHLLEMIIMLTGTVIISFVAGRLFSKNSTKEKELAKEEVNAIPHEMPANSTLFHDDATVGIQENAAQALFAEKEKLWQESMDEIQSRFQQTADESKLLKEEKEVLTLQVNQLYDCLKQQLSDLSSVAQFRETIERLQGNMENLQAENKQLTVSLEEYRTGQDRSLSPSQQVIVNAFSESNLIAENELMATQLKQAEQEKEKLAYAVVSLQDQIYSLEASLSSVGSGDGNKEASGSLLKLMEEKVQILQKERNDLMGQISQLENQLKITHLTSLSKFDLEQEEENPIKRLTLYIRMLEGEKQGLGNKITDMSKKLSQAEASMEQIKAKEIELTYVKTRLSALEKDKRDVQNQSGEWEVMYKKLYEKTHYLLSTKETELEQLKTTISFLEKDKSRLQGRITDMEAELRSSVFNYKGRNPLAFNL
jgi:DNA repair exonuclease SbcCD ATPase subunit